MFSIASARPSEPRTQPIDERREYLKSFVEKLSRTVVDVPTDADSVVVRPAQSAEASRPEPWWREARRQKNREVFGMAARGEFPDSLPVGSVAALASLTLGGVTGDFAAILERVIATVQAGLLQPDANGLLGRKAVREVAARLELQPGSALAAWLDAEPAAEATAQPAPAKRRGTGLKSEEINRTIQDAVARLEIGGVDWSEVSRAAFASWLCGADGPLAGQNPATISRSYLMRKGLADPACPTGRQDGDAEARAFEALRLSWAKAEDARKQGFSTPKLAVTR